jgi:cytochrome c-type biogenesis protein
MDIKWYIAFSSGLLSFFAPCVLPLIPSYLVFISDITIDDFESSTFKHRQIMLFHSVAFVLGFSFVFVVLGLSSSIIGYFLSTYRTYILKIGGIILIVIGLSNLDIINIPLLNHKKIVHLEEKPIGVFGSFIVGITFCLGWTPCIGPALSSILIIASTTKGISQGVYLLSMYSLGLAIPFVISAVLFDRLLGFLKKYGHVVQYTMKVMGVLLIVIGFLLLTSYFGRLSQWLGQLF